MNKLITIFLLLVLYTNKTNSQDFFKETNLINKTSLEIKFAPIITTFYSKFSGKYENGEVCIMYIDNLYSILGYRLNKNDICISYKISMANCKYNYFIQDLENNWIRINNTNYKREYNNIQYIINIIKEKDLFSLIISKY